MSPKKNSQQQASQHISRQFERDILGLIVDHMGDELTLIDRRGRIVYANEAALKGLGLSRKALYRKRIFELFAKKMSEKQWRKTNYDAIKNKGVPVNVIVNRLAADGRIQTMDVTAVYITYKGAGYILSIARNITEKLKMQDRLRASEDRYRLLAEGAADGIFTVDLKGHITYANHALINLTKIPIQKSFGTYFKKYVTRKTAGRALACFHAAKKGAARVTEEVDLIDGEGHVIPVEVNASPLFKDGKIIGVHAILRDIRVRREMDKLVRESEKRYRDLFEVANDALVLTDLNGIILGANQQAEELFKADRMSLIGVPQRQFFPPGQSDAYQWAFEKSRHGKGKACDLEVRDERGAKRPVSVYIRHIKAAGKDLMLNRFTDISERLKREEKIQESKKTEAFNLFISGTAQEIKHPLQVILAHVDRLMKEYKTREFEYIGFNEFKDIIRSMQSIAGQVRHCCDITDKLLTLNQKRKTGILKRECMINRLIRNVFNLKNEQLRFANIRLKQKLSPHLAPAAIACFEFEQVMQHVMNNAIEAMPSGGVLTVRTFQKNKGRQVQVEVKDQGIGISKEILPRVFDPFFSTGPKGFGQSAGLGLSVAQTIIRAAHGDISIKSSLRRGTVVTIVLPSVRTTTKKA